MNPYVLSAPIVVERIPGPVILACGGQDLVWDSCGHMESTLERLGGTGAAIVALRDDGPDVYGDDRARPLLAFRFRREDLAGGRWREAASWDIVEQASDDLRVELSTAALEPWSRWTSATSLP